MNGRKRHLLVDTGGLVLRVVVHPANIPDRDGAEQVLAGITARFPTLRHLWVDAGYAGKAVASKAHDKQLDRLMPYAGKG